MEDLLPSCKVSLLWVFINQRFLNKSVNSLDHYLRFFFFALSILHFETIKDTLLKSVSSWTFFLHQQERPPFSLKSILEPLKSIGPLFNLTRGCFLFHPLAQHLHFNDTFHPWGLVGMVSWVCSYWRIRVLPF